MQVSLPINCLVIFLDGSSRNGTFFGGSKAAGPNASLQLAHTYLYHRSCFSEWAWHSSLENFVQVHTLVMSAIWGSPAGFYILLSVLTMACTVQGCLDKHVGDAATFCNYVLIGKNIFFYHSLSLPCAMIFISKWRRPDTNWIVNVGANTILCHIMLLSCF